MYPVTSLGCGMQHSLSIQGENNVWDSFVLSVPRIVGLLQVDLETAMASFRVRGVGDACTHALINTHRAA